MLKHTSHMLLRFFAFLILFSITTAVFSCIASVNSQKLESTASSSEQKRLTVILDAGHGGEDGGAVSASGIFEKDLNLSIASRLKTLFEANGVEVIMTRTKDTLLYDRNVNYMGRKKVLDLEARKEIGEKYPNALFISIHMNAYPLTQYKGLQVWYSENNQQSREYAEEIQKTVCKTLQAENKRQIKPATSAIYLLHNLKSPSILIECGFLSNKEEAECLSDPAYQSSLAFAIFVSVMEAYSR